MSLLRTDVKAHRGITPDTAPLGYGPPDFQSAYNLPSATAGSGETVAIVDAGDDPTAEADLGVYRQQYGLPACTTANGCFEKVNQEGQQGSYPPVVSGWPVEESLDVDMVSAICPDCRILLVEANSADNSDMYAAVDEAVTLGAKYVSNSWGEGEYSGETADDQYFNHPGVAITAAGGDNGYDNYQSGGGTPNWPAASQYVTAVGGTSLARDSSVPHGWTEKTWSPDPSATGSGCSLYEPKPSWQTDTGCTNRMTNDVSADADPDTGAAIYDTTGEGGWLEVGGTSEATPIIAAVYALAGNPVAGTYPASYPYAVSSALNDVTSGSNFNQSCTPAYFCTAGPGYDGPTGLGTPNGVAAFTGGPHGDITGQVTSTVTGNPVPSATVTTAEGYSATTNSSGDYDLALPAGSYDLAAQATDYTSATQDGIQVSAGQDTTANFALAPDGSITGQVTSKTTGSPLAGVTVSVGSGATATTDNSGDYTLAVPAGGYNVTATGSFGYKNKTQDSIQVSPGQATTVNLALATKARQTLSGTVTDGSGHKWPLYAKISVSGDPDSPFYTSPYTGAYNISLPQRATYQLQVTPEEMTGYQPKTQTVRIGTTGTQKSIKILVDKASCTAPGYTDKPTSTGTDNCVAVRGGLVAGQVTDHNTDDGLDGATVSNVASPSETTQTTTAPSAGDGFYELFVAVTSSQQFTATDSNNYARDTETVPVTANTVTRQDFSLQAGQVAVTTSSLTSTVGMGGSKTANVTFTNKGTLPAHVTFGQQQTGFTPVDAQSAVKMQSPDTPQHRNMRGRPVPHTSGGTHSSRAMPGDASWTNIASYPEETEYNPVGSYGGKVYSFGGLQALPAEGPIADSFSYDPSTGTWTQISSMPQKLFDATGTFVGSTMYIAGGYTSVAGFVAHAAVSSVYAYDAKAGTWSQTANLPVPGAEGSTATIDGQLYVIGGYQSSSVYRYNPATNSWTQLASYPVPVTYPACAGIAGEIICAGGNSEYGGLTPYTATYIYNPATNTWTQAASMPYPDYAAASGTANGELLVAAGGIGNDGRTSQAVEYDPATNTWSALPDANQATGFSGGTCGPDGFYDIAGQGATTQAEMLPGYDQCGTPSAPWLSTSTSGFELAPGSSQTVTVTIDSSQVSQPGSYTADLSVGTDSPYPVPWIGVTMNVKPPKSWGELTGTVTSATTGNPVAGATIQICTMYDKSTGSCTPGSVTYTLTTAADGTYQWWLSQGYNPLQVVAAKDGYQSQAKIVKISKGTATPLNFSLTPD
jgi:N-acetylneuraminic acid mutarotase